jgi:chromosome segregation protein
MTFEKAKANYILEIDEDEARSSVNRYKRALESIGPVNLLAIDEYDRVSTRYDFLNKQNSDLEDALKDLLKIISELDEVMKAEFLRMFKQVQIEFDRVFKELFNGGEAKLELTDSSDLLECGINIVVTPPGKKLSSINLLSGGEKSLTAISLLFAILNIKNIPFCLFDEVEAALDEANVDRFGSYLQKYNNKTQLIIITHKKKTMEYANTLYGITMQESGVSKLVSVRLVDR